MTANTEFFNGMEAVYSEISRGDFDGKGTQEILFIEEYYGISANFIKCNLVLISKTRNGKIRVMFKKEMGRCG